MKFEIMLTASSYNTYESSMEIEAKDENEARKKIEEMDDEGKLEEKLQEDNETSIFDCAYFRR